jgi:hypothetical protein
MLIVHPVICRVLPAGASAYRRFHITKAALLRNASRGLGSHVNVSVMGSYDRRPRTRSRSGNGLARIRSSMKGSFVRDPVAVRAAPGLALSHVIVCMFSPLRAK